MSIQTKHLSLFINIEYTHIKQNDMLNANYHITDMM